MHAVSDFLNRSSRLADAFVTLYGITWDKEYMINEDIERERLAIIERTFNKVNELIESYKRKRSSRL